jgi:hypothetical protein
MDSNRPQSNLPKKLQGGWNGGPIGKGINGVSPKAQVKPISPPPPRPPKKA